MWNSHVLLSSGEDRGRQPDLNYKLFSHLSNSRSSNARYMAFLDIDSFVVAAVALRCFIPYTTQSQSRSAQREGRGNPNPKVTLMTHRRGPPTEGVINYGIPVTSWKCLSNFSRITSVNSTMIRDPQGCLMTPEHGPFQRLPAPLQYTEGLTGRLT